MHTALCDEVGNEIPIFAFPHCRDVAGCCWGWGCCSVNEKFGITPAAGLPDGLTRRHCVGKHDGYCETLRYKRALTLLSAPLAK